MLNVNANDVILSYSYFKSSSNKVSYNLSVNDLKYLKQILDLKILSPLTDVISVIDFLWTFTVNKFGELYIFADSFKLR